MLRKNFRPILCLLLVLSIPIFSPCNTGVIKKVLRGDLLQLGETFVARLTGLTVPSKDEVIGNKIYDFTKKELEGKTVKFFTWTKDNTAAGIVYDTDGHPFVEVLYGKDMSVSFNEVLLKNGYARVETQYLPENLKHYLDLEKEARNLGLGIWKKLFISQ